jgi:hypothetical protein
MDKDQARKPDGRVFAIRNIKIEELYRNPDYTCALGDGALSKTGRIVLFEVRSARSSDPSFVARWDGGNRSFLHKIKYEVDIDIVGVSKAEQRRFRKRRGGYKGHHTIRVNQDGNKYEVSIATPFGPVFEANVSFNQHGIALTTTNGIIASLKSLITKR